MDSEFLNIFLLTIILIIIIWIVWKSSEVRDIPPNFETINIGVRRSASLISQASTTSTNTIEENLSSSVEDIADNIFAEASESYNNSNNSYRNASHADDEELTEEERIIRDMDQDLPSHSHSSDENSESLRRRRRISLEPPQTSSASVDNSIEAKEDEVVEKISIKLKFLNDEIKVDKQAHLNETVLSFKRRNFKTELESKLIKLIFNGKLLEDDKKTLLQCGFFAEAVVHCLVLQKKTTLSTNSPASNQTSSARRRSNNSNYFNMEWNSTVLIYVFGMALATITLVLCWFARIQYEIYFSFYSTIGLILITTLFIILVPLFSMVLS